MEQKYAAWAEQLCTAGRSIVLASAELVLSCPSAPQAPWWVQLDVKHHTPRVPAMQGPEIGCHSCSGHVYPGMIFLPSSFTKPFPLLSYWYIAGLPSGPESENFPAVPPKRCSKIRDSAISSFSRLAQRHWASPHIPVHLSSLCLLWTCSALIICSQPLPE